MHATSAPDRWSLGTRVAFRFLAVYFVLAFLSSLVGIVPFLGDVGSWLDTAVHPLHVWIGRTVFGVEIYAFAMGSGDTTCNWVQFAAHIAVATVATVVWSVIDRKRTSHPWLRDGLWIAMRFVLASAMFGYGFGKVHGLQLPAPDVARLPQEYGQSSPMGLLWTFMGASQPYSMFGGWMEVIGGLLLCFRRTQLLGALWTAAAMTNVFVLNLCYDVPVKPYSFHLLALAIVIAAADLQRLARLLVLRDMRSAAGTDPSTAPPAGTLELFREGDIRLRLSGTLQGVRIEATCERRDAEDFPLLSRGFHWINEVPYNR